MAIRTKQQEKKDDTPTGYTKLRTGETLATAEYIERCNIWDLYYPEIKKTHAYERHQQQMIAFILGDMKFVQGCALQARQDLEKVIKEEISKPPYPDPRFVRYSISGDHKQMSNLKYEDEEGEYQEMAQAYMI